MLDKNGILDVAPRQTHETEDSPPRSARLTRVQDGPDTGCEWLSAARTRMPFSMREPARQRVLYSAA